MRSSSRVAVNVQQGRQAVVYFVFDQLSDVVFVFDSDLKNQIVIFHMIVVELPISFIGVSGIGKCQKEHVVELPGNRTEADRVLKRA